MGGRAIRLPFMSHAAVSQLMHTVTSLEHDVFLAVSCLLQLIQARPGLQDNKERYTDSSQAYQLEKLQ
ncbi:hypothetical protein ASE98_23900 [Pseudomonas sp. Leaf48]|nr:hypothetical protein ASE98_23900 [Pseudomonas sp. Leaf48]